MDRIKNTITVIAIAIMVLGLTVAASAQWRNRRGNDDHYGRNNVYLYQSVKNLKNNSRRFEDMLDRALDRSRYDGTRREDQLNRLAKRFKNAAEDLDDEFDGGRRMRRSYDEARKVINYGSQLDRALSRSRISNRSFNLRNYWRNIEVDLHRISRAYNIRYNGVYGRNGRIYRDDRNRRRRGRIGNRRYNRNLRATIVNLKNSARRFDRRIGREVRDRRNRRNRRWGYNSNLDNLAGRFKSATNRLEDEYDNARDYDDSYDEARRVLSIGQRLDRELSRNRVSRSTMRDWNRIEQDLRILANAYNLAYNGRYNNRSRLGVGNIIRNFPY